MTVGHEASRGGFTMHGAKLVLREAAAANGVQHLVSDTRNCLFTNPILECVRAPQVDEFAHSMRG